MTMNRKNRGISTSNLFWGTLLISWGMFWLILLLVDLDLPGRAVGLVVMLSPMFWIILGIILFFHSDSEIEEVKP